MTTTTSTTSKFTGTTRSRWLRRAVRAAARESLEVRAPWMGRGVCHPQQCRGGDMKALTRELGAFDALRAVVAEAEELRVVMEASR